jgi:hypothetical protein
MRVKHVKLDTTAPVVSVLLLAPRTPIAKGAQQQFAQNAQPASMAIMIFNAAVVTAQAWMKHALLVLQAVICESQVPRSAKCVPQAPCAPKLVSNITRHVPEAHTN